MKKKKISFPSALTVLFIVLIFAAILTAVVPAGLYSKLTYNADHDVFEITTPEGEVTEMAPTQESLDELGVTGNLNKFLDGSISKPIAVPGTYERVDQEPQGVFKILLAAISGVYDTIDIILFVFILGGCIGVLNYMGAFNAAIAALSKVTKGKEYILIILITIIIAAGGTTFGLAEETIALYPILVPVFLAAGYDVMVCIAAIYRKNEAFPPRIRRILRCACMGTCSSGLVVRQHDCPLPCLRDPACIYFRNRRKELYGSVYRRCR